MLSRVMEEYNGRTVAITGASGYLGSRLAAQLSASSCRLVLIDQSGGPASGPVGGAGAPIHVSADVCDPETWGGALRGVDVLFHLAAYEHRRGSVSDPMADLRVNQGAVLRILEYCRTNGLAPWIVLASSSHVCGPSARLPVSEDAPDEPLTLFGLHKLQAEKYLRHYSREHDVSGVSLRLANVYGPSQSRELSERAALNRMMSMGITTGRIVLFSNRHRIRDYVFIDDVVAAFLHAGRLKREFKGAHFVVGSEQGVRIEEAARMIANAIGDLSGRRPHVEVDRQAVVSANENRDFVADASRFKLAGGWDHRVGLADGIGRTVASLAGSNGAERRV